MFQILLVNLLLVFWIFYFYQNSDQLLIHQLIEILGKRMQVADAIGQLKKDHNVAVLQSKRWNEILGKMILEGEEKNLSEEFVLRMFKAIHQESINHQKEIINH